MTEPVRAERVWCRIESGVVREEIVYAQEPTEIGVDGDGKPVLRPLFLVKEPVDHITCDWGVPTYDVQDVRVVKTFPIVDVPVEQQLAARQALAKLHVFAQLPQVSIYVPAVCRAILELDRACNANPSFIDPPIITDADRVVLKAIVATALANPVPTE